MTNVTSQVEVTFSPKHSTEIAYNEAFGVVIIPGIVSHSEIYPTSANIKGFQKETVPLAIKSFLKLNRKVTMNIGYKEKKGEGSTVFVPYQNSTLQDASYQILL